MYGMVAKRGTKKIGSRGSSSQSQRNREMEMDGEMERARENGTKFYLQSTVTEGR